METHYAPRGSLNISALKDRMSQKLHEAMTVREEEPQRLSTVNRLYSGDIETIVAKALEKDKTRRYASAAELAADIRRYLKDEPIVARPASTAYQLRKFAQRNRALGGHGSGRCSVGCMGGHEHLVGAGSPP